MKEVLCSLLSETSMLMSETRWDRLGLDVLRHVLESSFGLVHWRQRSPLMVRRKGLETYVNEQPMMQNGM